MSLYEFVILQQAGGPVRVESDDRMKESDVDDVDVHRAGVFENGLKGRGKGSGAEVIGAGNSLGEMLRNQYEQASFRDAAAASADKRCGGNLCS